MLKNVKNKYYYIISNHIYSLLRIYYVICYLNLEKEAVIDSDDSINNDKDEKIEDKKKRYQKKIEEKTSKQDDVRYFFIV